MPRSTWATGFGALGSQELERARRARLLRLPSDDLVLVDERVMLRRLSIDPERPCVVVFRSLKPSSKLGMIAYMLDAKTGR